MRRHSKRPAETPTYLWRPLRVACLAHCEDGMDRPVFTLDRDTIGEPLCWKVARDVTLGCDPFARFVRIEETAAIFAVMASCGWSKFRVYTKHPETMRAWLAWIALGGASAVAIYNAGHEVHFPTLEGQCRAPTPELRFLYDVGAPRVDPCLRGRAARREQMSQCHWREWPLNNVQVESQP